jgi:DHA3 family macrolide efflux protein-like MFS transporter
LFHFFAIFATIFQQFYKEPSIMASTTSWKRNVTFFLTGQAISLFGSMMVQYAILWHITLTTQSGTAMMVYVVAGILPIFFTTPFGGVWADRYNRKNLINLADGSIAFVSLVMAVILLCGYDSIVLLFVCATLRAFGQGVQMPAVGAIIPQIVSTEHLSKVNGINSSIQSFVQIVSPMAGGALMTFMSLQTLFFVDVVTAIIGIVLLYFFVKTPEKQTAETNLKPTEISYFRDIKEGFSYVYKNRFIWHLVLITIAIHLLISPAAFLTTLQVTRDFGAEVWRLTAIEVAFSTGMMLGGVIVGFWGGFRNKIYSLALSVFISGIFTAFLGVLDNFWLYLVAMWIIGLSIPLYSTPEMVLLQTRTDNAYLGRVMSVFSMVATLVMPAGMLLFGPLGDIVSIDLLLIISGILLGLQAIPLLASKELKQNATAES